MKTTIDDASENDIGRWAQPLILDRLSEVYYRANPGNHLRAATLVTVHYRAWRALLRGDQTQLTTTRKDLLNEAVRAGLSRDHVNAADKAVLEELYIVVRQRFRASRHLSAACLRPLRDAMAHLQEQKIAA